MSHCEPRRGVAISNVQLLISFFTRCKEANGLFFYTVMEDIEQYKPLSMAHNICTKL